MKRTELILLYLYPIVAALICLAATANLLASVIFFFAVPGAYLSWRRPQLILRAGIFSAIFSLPIFLILDYIAERSGSWSIPESLFPFHIFGVVPAEQLIWGFFGLYFVIIFYEYFWEGRHTSATSSRMKYLALAAISTLVLFLYVLTTNPASLFISYFYLKLGIFLVALPILTFLTNFPALLKKFIDTGIYFSVLSLIYEITALKLNLWTFPSAEFVGKITIFNLSFPVEELVFWIALGSLAALSFYEFFDDDRK